MKRQEGREEMKKGRVKGESGGREGETGVKGQRRNRAAHPNRTLKQNNQANRSLHKPTPGFFYKVWQQGFLKDFPLLYGLLTVDRKNPAPISLSLGQKAELGMDFKHSIVN